MRMCVLEFAAALASLSVCAQAAPDIYDLGKTKYDPAQIVGERTDYDRAYAANLPYMTWCSLGKTNWEPLSASSTGSLWQQAKNGTITWPSFLTANGGLATPDMQPHGDILGYTMGGVGDVNGDGYPDYAVTWYDAELRIEPTSTIHGPNGGPPGFFQHLNLGDDRVGYVRVISGHPTSPGDWPVFPPQSTADTDTYHRDTPSSPLGRMAKIGPDFWGKSRHGLWAHEMFTLGDLDGDGRSEMLLSANSAGTGGGLLEVWAWTDRYYPAGYTGSIVRRWVKLMEITGVDDSTDPDGAGPNTRTVVDEFGYQAYENPIPRIPQPTPFGADTEFNGGVDFNNDGQPDLIVGSRFHRDYNEGHFVHHSENREHAPGAVWVFLMPQVNVFSEIASRSQHECDVKSNWTDDPEVDGITDELPLRMTTDDYSVKIIGSQQRVTQSGIVKANTCAHTFGYKFDPAGDLDGDNVMDLAVTAPFHIDPDRYGSTPDVADYEGVVYLFLSSSIRDTGSNDRWSDSMLPKFYTTNGFQIKKGCSGFYATQIINSNGSSSPVKIYSDDADYILVGNQKVQNSRTGFGANIEAGVDLNGNADPDLVVTYESNADNQVFVFYDLQSTVLADISSLTSVQTSPRKLWQYGQGASNILSEAVTIRSGPALAGQSGTHLELNGNGLTYAPINGTSLAGDHDGDGDCELFLSCNAAVTGKCLAVIDLPADPTTINYNDHVLARINPETLDGYTYTPGDTGFNSIHSHHSNLRGWPLWHTQTGQKHDMLIAARGFPRLIDQFMSGGNMHDVNLTAQQALDPTVTQWLTIPSGKVYRLETGRGIVP